MSTTQADIDTIKDLLDNPVEAETKGEVDETDIETNDTEDTNTSIDEVDQGDDLDDGEDESIEVEDESKDSDSDESTESTEEVSFPQTITELAKEIDVEPKELYNLDIPMADGEPAVKLGDLKNQFQEATRTTARLQDEVQQLRAQTTTVQEQSTAKIELIGQFNEIQRQYNETDWGAIERQDPGRAALLKQKFVEATSTTNQQIETLNNEERGRVSNRIVTNTKKVLDIIPEWSDTSVRNKEIDLIREALRGEGVSDKEINTIDDPLTIKLMRELVGYREANKQAKTIVKKVVKKRLGPLKSKARPNKVKNKTDNLIQKAKKTNDKNDTLAAARSILGY